MNKWRISLPTNLIMFEMSKDIEFMFIWKSINTDN